MVNRRQVEKAHRSALERGFTLVELMTASLVMSAVLLGIYAVFHQAIGAETSFGRRWADRQAAETVVAHLADALVQSVCPSDESLDTIVAGPDPVTNGWALACLTLRPTGGMERLRYTWSESEADAGGITLRLQRAIYAGDQNLSDVSPSDSAEDADNWEHCEPVIIARRLGSLSVHFRETGQAGASWLDKWQGPGGKVIVRIRAQVADQALEKLVLPSVAGPLQEQTEDESPQEDQDG